MSASVLKIRSSTPMIRPTNWEQRRKRRISAIICKKQKTRYTAAMYRNIWTCSPLPTTGGYRSSR